MSADGLSRLDYTQVIKKAGVALDMSGGIPDTGLGVLSVGGTLVPEAYDELALTYVAAGNGAGEVETVTYRLNAVDIATLTLAYDASNRVTSVVRS